MNPLWNEIAKDTLSPEQLAQLDAYLDLMLEKNARLNLTRITNRAEAEIKHVADALSILTPIDMIADRRGSSTNALLSPGEAFDFAAGAAIDRDIEYLAADKTRSAPLRLADVGTGCGVPGAILAIARPQVRVTLIDATRKKLDAVQSICDTIGVRNVRTLHARVETVKETFDVITARAVADFATLVDWCGPLLNRPGILLALKGPKARSEVNEAWPRIKKQGLHVFVVDLKYDALAGHSVITGIKSDARR